MGVGRDQEKHSTFSVCHYLHVANVSQI